MRSKLIKSFSLFVAAVIIVSAMFMAGRATPVSASPAEQTGWTTVFADEFNGAANSGVDTSKWKYDLGHGYPGGAGNWGTGEVQNYTNSTTNIRQDGAGHLVITMLCCWSSARIETPAVFSAPIGGVMRIEGRIQQPNVSGAGAMGYWPAFWALGENFRPSNTNWPGSGELDILEDVNGRSSVFGTLHCGFSPGGPCNEKSGRGSGERACPGCQTSFHLYAVEYDRGLEEIRWFLDSTNYFTLRRGEVDPGTWDSALHHGYFLLLNLAMGGEFPAALGGGPTGSTVSGGQLIVDYVHVMTKGTSGTGPTPIPPTPIPSTPYTTAVNLPGTVQAENFDRGGFGVAYMETTPGNQGGYNYRNDGNADVDFASNCGICVNYIAPGEWLRYSVNVTAAGTYTLGVRHAGPGTGTYHVELENGTNLTGSLIQPNTGSWDTYQSQNVSINLPSGSHILKFVFDTCNACNMNNIDSFTFTSTSVKTNTPSVPTNTPVKTNIPGGPTATRTSTPRPTATTSGGTTTWAPNVWYAIGAQVLYNGHTYKCIQAHTSLTGWEPPNVPALWQFIS